MKNKLLIMMFCFTCLFSTAQVTLNVQLPPAGVVQKDQLWNLIAINSNNNIYDAIISLDLQDVITGQTVMSAVSRNFSLGKGVKIFNIRDVQPLQYNYLAAELSGTFIPLGTYIACYRITRNDDKNSQPLAVECVRMTINPLSPPLLTSPSDKAVLESPYPRFTWLPPAPSDMFTSLTYDFVIMEVLPGQTPSEAVQSNAPVYSGHALFNSFENYLPSFPALKKGQQYAWQVIARNAGNYSAQTEVWSFAIGATPDENKIQGNTEYVALSNNVPGISYLTLADKVQFKYYSYENDQITQLRILDGGGKIVKEIRQKVKYGNNLFEVKLGKNFKQGEVYTAEISDSQKKIYSAKFVLSAKE